MPSSSSAVASSPWAWQLAMSPAARTTSAEGVGSDLQPTARRRTTTVATMSPVAILLLVAPTPPISCRLPMEIWYPVSEGSPGWLGFQSLVRTEVSTSCVEGVSSDVHHHDRLQFGPIGPETSLCPGPTHSNQHYMLWLWINMLLLRVRFASIRRWTPCL